MQCSCKNHGHVRVCSLRRLSLIHSQSPYDYLRNRCVTSRYLSTAKCRYLRIRTCRNGSQGLICILGVTIKNKEAGAGQERAYEIDPRSNISANNMVFLSMVHGGIWTPMHPTVIAYLATCAAKSAEFLLSYRLVVIIVLTNKL